LEEGQEEPLPTNKAASIAIPLCLKTQVLDNARNLQKWMDSGAAFHI